MVKVVEEPLLEEDMDKAEPKAMVIKIGIERPFNAINVIKSDISNTNVKQIMHTWKIQRRWY